MHYSELNFPKDVSTSSESSDEFTPAKVVVINVVQNRMQLPNLVRGVERFQISNRAGAFIANCVLSDFNVISSTNKQYVIDNYASCNVKGKYRTEIRENEAIFFPSCK